MPTWLLSVAPYAICAILAGSSAGYGVHRWDESTIADMRAADAQARAAAVQAVAKVQKAQDDASLASAVAEAKAQAALNVTTQTIVKRIPVYVTQVQDHSVCGLTVGLMRVLRAAASGADPGTLSLAAGQLDDSCSDATPSEVASWFAQYAGTAQANAEQLNALEASVVALHGAATK